MNDISAEFEKWLEGRPPHVIASARRYPPGTCLEKHGKIWWVVGYHDDDGRVLVTPINPAVDYERAVAERAPICPCCMDKLDSLLIQEPV
jgi:hypothetical protein